MRSRAIRPVVRSTATEKAAHEIQTLILSGEWKPSEALPSQKNLAATLGVSMTVMREASEILKQRGLIRIAHGEGMFVANPSLSGIRGALELFIEFSDVNLLELCDIRLLIEPNLARRAAKNASKESTSTLSKIAEELNGTANSSSAHISADLEFHKEIGVLAKQPIFSAIVEALQAPIERSMLIGLSATENVRRSDEQHRAICDAIIRGDENAAEAHMRDHQLFIRSYVTRTAEGDA